MDINYPLISTTSGNEVLSDNNVSNDLESKTSSILDGSPTKRASVELEDKNLGNNENKKTKDVHEEPPAKKVKTINEEDKGSHCDDGQNKKLEDEINKQSSNMEISKEVCSQNDSASTEQPHNESNGNNKNVSDNTELDTGIIHSKNDTDRPNTEQPNGTTTANLTPELGSEENKPPGSPDIIIIEERFGNSIVHTNSAVHSKKYYGRFKPLAIPGLAKRQMTMINIHKLNKLIKSTGRCQREIKKLNAELAEDIMKLEGVYYKRRKPYLQKRNELFKKLPTFWRTAFSGHGFLNSFIQTEEKECLTFMTNCEVDVFKDNLGYKITFHFDENPYIENNILSKTLKYPSSFLAKSESTDIKWKDGMNLLKKYCVMIAKNSVLRRDLPATFFSWFLDKNLGREDPFAEAIKEDLYPFAMKYYNEHIKKKKRLGHEDDSQETVILISDDSDSNSDKEEGDVCGTEKDDDSSSIETLYVNVPRPKRVPWPSNEKSMGGVHVDENPSDKEEDIIALAEMGGNLRDSTPESEPEYLPHEREIELIDLCSSQENLVVLDQPD